jgi:hypothetical protein
MADREHREVSQWKIDVNEETGIPFWRGREPGDKEDLIFDAGETLTMKPECFPPGTRVIVIEPRNAEWYRKYFAT